MKKKLVILVLFMSVFLLAGCSKKDKEKEMMKLQMPSSIGVLEFSYPKSNSFSLVENYEEENGDAIYSPTVYCNDLAISMQFGAVVVSSTEYNEYIESSKSFGKYREFAWNDYKGFVVTESNEALRFAMVLKGDKKSSEKTLITGYATFTNPADDSENVNIFKTYNNTIIKDFFSSVKIKEEEKEKK